MAFIKKKVEEIKEKILDVDASMQGTLAFKDPVNLRINGKFEGRLDTKGTLVIGEHAIVKADINGEHITIAGKVNGNIVAQKELIIIAPGCVIGDVKTPLIKIEEGAFLEGRSIMLDRGSKPSGETMTIEQVAEYLEVDRDVVLEWADTGKLPARKEGAQWRFEKSKVEEWLANERIK